MARLEWDKQGERCYEAGVEQAAIYPMNGAEYGAGEAWNGLTAVTESPSGAEATALYANNKKYGELQSAEEFGGTIEAYMYPDGFAECNGEKTIAKGLRAGQQIRKPFGMVYKTLIGNDTESTKHGYKLHFVYNAKVKPSEKANNTINESPEAGTMSWEFSTTPVTITGHDPSSHLTLTSTDFETEEELALLKSIEDEIYGTDEKEAKLLLPDELIAMLGEDALTTE